MLFALRTKAQFVEMINDLAQIVAAVNPVFDLAEYLANLIFDGIWPAGFLFEAMQVGKQLAVNKVA